MSLGSLVMQIWCKTCAAAPQGCSQGTFLWKEPEKGTGSWLLRGQSCFFHHQYHSAQGFRSPKCLQSSMSNSFRITVIMQFLFVNGCFQCYSSRTDMNIGKDILYQGAQTGQDIQDLQLQPFFPHCLAGTISYRFFHKKWWKSLWVFYLRKNN